MSNFDLTHKFVDGVFLLKLTTPTSPSLIAMSKGIDNLNDDIKMFEFCTPTSQSEYDDSCLFVINSGSLYYYTLFFHYGDKESYELVIKSYQHCVNFFFQFLRNLFSAFFEFHSSFDPNNVFNLATTLIRGWPTNLENTMFVVMPDNIRRITFTNEDFTYFYFKPSHFFPSKILPSILLCMFAMQPILFVAPNAALGCRACFSAVSLFHPLVYTDPMVLWLRKSDSRFSEILESPEKNSPYLIVSTDDPTEIESKFALVVQCDDLLKENPKVDAEFHDLVRKIFVVIQSEFESLLNINPYSDILNLPWASKNLEELTKNPKFAFLPPFGALQRFQNSDMIRQWRIRRSNNTAFRNHLLHSGEMNFEGFSVEQLVVIDGFLKKLKEFFHDDVHSCAVIKKHLAIIENILKK